MTSFGHFPKSTWDKEDVSKVAFASNQIQQHFGSFSCEEPQWTQNIALEIQTERFSDLQAIWEEWSLDNQTTYIAHFRDLLHLTKLPINETMIKAAIRFWDPKRNCFNFNNIDLVPTVEEYRRLLDLPVEENIKVYKPDPQKSCKAPLSQFLKISRKQASSLVLEKEGRETVPLRFIWDEMKKLPEAKAHELYTLAVYGVVIFPMEDSEYIDGCVLDLALQVMEGIDPTPAILAETIRSLSQIHTTGTGRFIGCLPLLSTWLQSHLPCAVSRFRSVYFLPATTIMDILRSKWHLPEDLEEWVNKFRNLTERDIVWVAPWMPPANMLYSCGRYNWVPLLGPWGGTAYAPLQAGRQLGGTQIIPVLHGIESCNIKHEKGRLSKTAVKMHEAWFSPRRIKINMHPPEVLEAYTFWRHKRRIQLNPSKGIEATESLQQENEALRRFIQGQEQAIRNVTGRLRRRDEQLETVVNQRDATRA